MDLSEALGDGSGSGQVNSPWPGQQNGQNSGGSVWPGQPPAPNNPAWPGQPPAPNNPAWPGQPPAPAQPAWPGQLPAPAQPAWPGQPPAPAQPTWPGQSPAPAQPTWPGQSPPQQVPLTVPYSMSLPRGVHDKLLITISGQMKPHPKSITINLSRGNDIALHFNPRFNDAGKKVIVRNSSQGGKWGKEERGLSNFPFSAGQNFVIKILCTHNEFKVAVNSSHLLEFKHRIRDLSQINHLNIYDDVTLTSVNIESLP